MPLKFDATGALVHVPKSIKSLRKAVVLLSPKNGHHLQSNIIVQAFAERLLEMQLEETLAHSPIVAATTKPPRESTPLC